MAFNHRTDMKSIIIFLIWLGVAVIGVIAKSKKKSQEQGNTPPLGQPRYDSRGMPLSNEQTRKQQLQEMWDRQRKMAKAQAEKDDNITDTPPQTPEAEPMAEEGIAATEPVQPTPQPTPAPKGRELDFDPEEMVIYSEIMQPGYEKY